MIITFIVPYGSLISQHPRKTHECLAFNLRKQETYKINPEDYKDMDNFKLANDLFYAYDKDKKIKYGTESIELISKLIKKCNLKSTFLRESIYVDDFIFVSTYEYIGVFGLQLFYDIHEDSKVINRFTELIEESARHGIYCSPLHIKPDMLSHLNKRMRKTKTYFVDRRNIYFMKQTKKSNMEGEDASTK